MKRYEYIARSIPDDSPYRICQYINSVAEEGWRLVVMQKSKGTATQTLYFERECE